MHRRSFGNLALGLGCAGLLAGTLALAPAASGAENHAAARPSTPAAEFCFSGGAYGTKVNVNNTVTSGQSAFVTIGCTSVTGVHNTDSAVSVNAPPGIHTGTIDTSAASEKTSTGIATVSSASVQNLNVLGGAIRATAIKSVSTTSHNTSTKAFAVSAAGTTFLGLVIAGTPITETPAPNTKEALPGIGLVTLNQQISRVGATGASLRVIAIDVSVTKSNSMLPIGAQIIVSSATSSLGGPVVGLLRGNSYGSYAAVGTTLIAGRTFPEYLLCQGTDGKTLTNSGVAVHIPGALQTGTVSETAEGVDTAKTVSGEVTATVQNLNLAGGEITASAVKADVTATGNPPTLGDKSSFVNLHVAGNPNINDSVPVNTEITLPDIGNLWLHRQVKTKTGITVIMLELDVTVPGNPTGLKVGAVVDVSYAHVAVT